MTDSDDGGATFLLSRLLFGGGIAVMALDNFRNPEGVIGCADAEGVPEHQSS